MAKKTAPRKKNRKDNSFKAGLIAFGVTLLGYASLFKFHRLSDFLLGGGIALLVSSIVKAMATPMKGIEKTADAAPTLDADNVVDDFARSMVESGVDLLGQLRAERDAIREQVFTRRLNNISDVMTKLLQRVIDSPENATHIRRLITYYLPTTVKLLQSYRSNKAQGLSYMDMSKSREQLLDWLDKLQDASHSVLDKVIQADLLDDSAEMEVLDQMLRYDGFATDEEGEKLRTSAAQAAAKPDLPPMEQPRTATAAQLDNGTPTLQIPATPNTRFKSFYQQHQQNRQSHTRQ